MVQSRRSDKPNAKLILLTGNVAGSIIARPGAGEADYCRTANRVIHTDWYLLNVHIAGCFGCIWAIKRSA